MMTQPLAGAKSVVTENELDIRGLFRVLWAGKLWIAGIALGFALLALAYTFFAKQEWSATAITDGQRLTCWGVLFPAAIPA
jgi:lipopolysaccharide biosynthesis protein WzzE